MLEEVSRMNHGLDSFFLPLVLYDVHHFFPSNCLRICQGNKDFDWTNLLKCFSFHFISFGSYFLCEILDRRTNRDNVVDDDDDGGDEISPSHHQPTINISSSIQTDEKMYFSSSFTVWSRNRAHLLVKIRLIIMKMLIRFFTISHHLPRIIQW